jgi:hypothetical protein
MDDMSVDMSVDPSALKGTQVKSLRVAASWSMAPECRSGTAEAHA